MIQNEWVTNEQTSTFRLVDSEHYQVSHVWVLIWLCKSKEKRQNFATQIGIASIFNLKPGKVCADFAGDIETRTDTSIYEFPKPLPI